MYKVTVPGSLMLFGEHAVLHGKHALVAAIDKYLSVTLTPRLDRKISIDSALGKHETTLGRVKVIKPYEYLLTAILQFASQLNNGFDLVIAADFSSQVGFGSSAAVTVATLGVLNWWLGGKQAKSIDLYHEAVKVVRKVQGFGSGADVVATIFGGVIAYRACPLMIKKIADNLPLVVVYSGVKVPTTEVVKKVKAEQKVFPSVFSELYQLMDSCVIQAIREIKKIKKGAFTNLGKLMDLHQGLQDALGVSNLILSNIIFKLREMRGIKGAKISGSGLGDCVIALGKTRKEVVISIPKVQEIKAKISKQGISYSK